ncbi:hypothetical protein GCM10009850_029380 [Nonomuraea monospora]|uniref:Aminoglycoside phosphotransferase domain-containing protein n=1 Tax=Nonomuraea monospora TaxID=568818 RepID=A0ABP5P6R7_9ACTN
MTCEPLPPDVLAALQEGSPERITCHAEPIRGSSGAATATLTRLTVQTHHKTLVRKELHPIRTGRHAPFATDPRHWAYWRREPLAYASGLLPTGPGLTTPHCYATVDNVLYLEDVQGKPEAPATAAARLAVWQAATPLPDVPWLGGHQLPQRLRATTWTPVDADPRIERLWRQRDDLLARLAGLPTVLSHGDFSAGNILATPTGATVLLDWATLSAGPVGADLAALALSTFTDPLDAYLAGTDRFARADVELGYRATLALTGAGRVHWMLSRGMPVPDGYEEFILSRRP